MSQPAPQPNVLFFFADDQRFDTIEALGNPHIHTPNLDALVERGVAFTHAHVMGGTTGAVCMASRAMLHTGRTLFHLDRKGACIPEGHRLMGEVFQDAGYETFGTGKWHNGADSYARSFTNGASIFFGGMQDHWNVPACDFHPDGQYPARPKCQNPLTSKQCHMRQADRIECGHHSTDLFADETAEFLRNRDRDKPFFAYLSFMAPHDPRIMPQKYLDRYADVDLPVPANAMPEHPFDNGELAGRDEKLEAWPRTPEAIRGHLRDYYAMITHLDDAMGRVLATLEETGCADNTIIVFAGDNGLALGQHGLMGKQSLYDHSTRVPLLMAGPGVPRGQRNDALCYLYDIFPTLCGLCGMETPESVDGLGLTATMEKPAQTLRPVLHTAYTDLHRAVRDRRYKLIEYVVGDARHTQLFDLLEDPGEMVNLAGYPEYAETLQRLRCELRKLRTEQDDAGEMGDEFWGGYEGGGG